MRFSQLCFSWMVGVWCILSPESLSSVLTPWDPKSPSQWEVMIAGILSQPPNGRTDNYPLPTLRWKMVLGKLEVVTQNIFQVLKNRTPFQLLAQCLLTIGHHKSTVLVWEINSFKLVYNHLVKGCKFGFHTNKQNLTTNCLWVLWCHHRRSMNNGKTTL